MEKFLSKIKLKNKILWDRLYSIYLSLFFKKFIKCSFPVHVHNPYLIKVGKNVIVDKRTRLEAFENNHYQISSPKIIIGNDVHINWNCHIGAINLVEIGDNVLIGSNVFITDHSHGRNNFVDLSIPPEKRQLFSKGPVVIKNNVWIGENVSILPNITIGENTIIGANSVVTKSMPSDCIVAGNPAKIVRRI